MKPVPFDAGTRNGFMDREAELGALRRLGGADGGGVPGTVIVTGRRGIGKTALLKRLHHELFWEDGGAAPFYYRFRRATLKGADFSRDFYSRFVRQLASYIRRDPAIAPDMSAPIERLIYGVPAPASSCMARLHDDLSGGHWTDDLTGRLAATASVPHSASTCISRRFVVMLDDFHLADGIYDRTPGDMPDIAGIFADLLDSPNCGCIVTGQPEMLLERIFSDDALRGAGRRMRLGPLRADTAFELFSETCRMHGASAVDDDCRPLMKHLSGNPLYIRNMAEAATLTGAAEITARTFMECYGREVTGGETFAYWSSVIKSCTKDTREERLGVRLLATLAEDPGAQPDAAVLARGMGTGTQAVLDAMGALELSGMLPGIPGAPADTDTVLGDFVFGLRARELDEFPHTPPGEAVMKRRFGRDADVPVTYELAIPNRSEAELVAVKAAEQICAGVDIDDSDVGKLTMAVIEACINAMEHGSGSDGRVLLKYHVYPERIEVFVESRGIMPGTDTVPDVPGGMPGLGQRRGRGFSLMRGFVDDLRVERVGDYTRVVLVKTIKPVKDAR